MDTDVLTITEAAVKIGRSRARVKQLVAQGAFPGAQLVRDRLWVIPMADVRAYRSPPRGPRKKSKK